MNPMYSAGLITGLAVTSPYWVWRAAKKNELHLTAARLGFTAWDVPAGARDPVWIHAVSVGEVQAAMPLVRLLNVAPSRRTVAVSVTTRTGISVAKSALRRFPGVVGPLPSPIDVPWAVRRRVREMRPSALILIDTEIWPNLISSARASRAKIFLANGRISDKSFPRYRAIRSFLRQTLDQISVFWMQSDLDARRIVDLGAPAGRVRVAGNLKIDALAAMIDMEPRPVSPAPLVPPLIIAASTHPGEEEIIIDAAAAWKSRGRAFRLAIAPRHPERAAAVISIVESAGFRAARRSELNGPANAPWLGAGTDSVLIIDTIGELNRFFPAALAVYIGGSLVPKGGHNIFEPAAAGRPVIFGPHMENFRDADLALNGHGARKVFSADELSSAFESLLDDPALAESMGRAARAAFESQKGAARRIVDELEAELVHA